jgi:V/A-type H+-transporting ATPase subunit C
MDDYAYMNARIRAMQGRLLGPPAYQELMARESTADLLEHLLESPYAQALELTRSRLSAPGSPLTGIGQRGTEDGSLIDRALRHELVRRLSKLRRFASDRPRELLETLALQWDAYNLKTIVRGKRANAAVEELLASTFPVGALDEIALAELARAPTVHAVVDTIATWRHPLAQPLREGLKAYGETESLQPVEFELDRWTFAEAFRRVSNGDPNELVVRDFLRLLADKANILTALRYLHSRTALSPIEAARHFLDVKGRFTRVQFQAIVAARDFRQGLSLLGDTPYALIARKFAAEESVALPRIERELEQLVLWKTLALSRQDPLGIGLPIAYLEQQINEVRNLRMIVRGKVAGLGAEQIEEWLIMS